MQISDFSVNKYNSIIFGRFSRKKFRESLESLNKVDKIDRKDLLRKKEKRNKDRIPCLITYKRKLSMMCKTIKKYWNVLQINLELRETFHNNRLWHLKETKIYKKL